MARTTIGSLQRGNIYAMVYGPEGAGKTLCAMSLSAPGKKGEDIGYITAETGGVQSLRSMGFSSKIPVHVVPPAPEDPFPAIMAGIQDFARDPLITSIVLDGCSVLCQRAITFFSKGKGMRGMGFAGWDYILQGFWTVEQAAEKVTRGSPGQKAKSFIYTAWDEEPSYSTDPFDQKAAPTIDEPGRPMMYGKAKRWLPGNCDILGRLTSKFVADPKRPGAKVYKGSLQINASERYIAKCRWNLGSDAIEPNFRAILDKVEKMGVPSVK